MNAIRRRDIQAMVAAAAQWGISSLSDDASRCVIFCASMLTRRIPLLLAATLWAVSGVAAQSQTDEMNRALALLPGYHVLAPQERDSDAQAYFHRHFPGGDPSVVRADFSSDGRSGYALLLKSNKSEARMLVVVLCPKSGSCEKAYELDEGAYLGSAYLRPITPGSIIPKTDIPGGGPAAVVRLRATGIRIIYFNKAEVVLYWNAKHKKIEEIVISD